ncbi:MULTISPECIES: hypothetical protein [Bacillota]|uniref:hypothetical protein n=1 Tax=Bacillota TaxID=1239 RepID=UPI0039EFE73E
MKKLNSKKIISFVTMAAVFAFVFMVFSPEEAAAAWKKAGITPSGDIKNSTIYKDLDTIVYLVMAVGGFWVLLCLLFAGMKLAAAQGNPQARTQGFVGLAMSALGLFIIVKAYDIAGWVAGFGS